MTRTAPKALAGMTTAELMELCDAEIADVKQIRAELDAVASEVRVIYRRPSYRILHFFGLV
jgi:hypothetical protein